MAGFDINERSTWAWVNGGQVTCSEHGEYLLNPQDPHSFYQCSQGVPYLHQCAQESDSSKMVFDPRVNVCVFDDGTLEPQIYDWAVKNGLVTDQR